MNNGLRFTCNLVVLTVVRVDCIGGVFMVFDSDTNIIKDSDGNLKTRFSYPTEHRLYCL